MSNFITCRCGKKHDTSNYLWDIGRLKGYRGKFIKCDCGNEVMRLYPKTKKLLDFWNSLRKGRQIK